MKISDIGFLKTEWNRTDLKIQKLKTQFLQFGFQKNDSGGLQMVFSRCLVNSSTSNMIASTVKVFFFMLYLCTCDSESNN